MIYFIQARSGPVKIGFSDVDPQARLAALQTGCPEPLSLLGAIPGTTLDEAVLHARFAQHRQSGEWFQPAPALLAFIRLALRPAFAALVAVEPRLEGLLGLAVGYHSDPDPHFCRNGAWYGYGPWANRGIKPVLLTCVGWAAEVPELRTGPAYDVAYDGLLDSLPECRDCMCGR